MASKSFGFQYSATLTFPILYPNPFTPDLFPTLEERFPTFLDEHQDSLDSCEFLIPIELNDLVDDGQITVDVLETSANWYGVTYKEDKELVTGAIKTLVKQRTYPNKLWKE